MVPAGSSTLVTKITTAICNHVADTEMKIVSEEMKLQQSNTATVLVHLLQYQGAMEATSSKHLGKPGSEDKYNDMKSCRNYC